MVEQPPSPPQPAAGVKIDVMATASLALAIVGLIAAYSVGLLSVVVSAVAIALGVASGRRIRDSGGALAGAGRARAGWILGVVGIVASILLSIALYITLKNFLA